MAGYSVENLKEVQNQGENFGIDPSELQLRMAKDPLECANAGISYLKLGPDFRVPFGHTHKTQEEIYVLITGSGRMKIGDDVVELEQWDAVRVPPDTMRGFEAGPDGLGLIAIGSPSTGPGDAEVTPGWWSD
jgi:mannose-6-phosphate isomerase-like protein (cupin superfamily)